MFDRLIKKIKLVLSLSFLKKSVHSLSDVKTLKIGKKTNIWQYTVILEGATIGNNCNICSHCFIDNNVVIGNNVTIKNGVKIYSHTVIEDNVFIGPNTIFLNDKYPKSKEYESFNFRLRQSKVSKGSTIGGNVTILPAINIGKNVMIGAGSIISKDIPENSIVYGVAAKVRSSS